MYPEQNGAGSWWHSDDLPPGEWHWGRYHNQRDAGGRERHLKEERENLKEIFLKFDGIAYFSVKTCKAFFEVDFSPEICH